MIFNAHPAQVELARVFSSVRLLGPPLDEKLVALVAHLFSPEEAEIAVYLPFYYPRPLSKIARKARRNAEALRPILDRMGERRVILKTEGGYALLPLIPGMFEYMLMDGRDSEWHRKYAELLLAVWTTGYVEKYNRRATPAVRNIPVQSAVAEHKSVVVEADLMSEMIDRHRSFSVAHVCQCRQSMRFTGRECRRAEPEDGCLIFGSFAESQERNQAGRRVSREEMRDIVAERWEKKLVFLTGNVAPDSPNAICTCCDCCCHFLETVNHWEGKVLVAPPHFRAQVNVALCKDCGKCAQACNTQAHTMTKENEAEKKTHRYEPDKCLGCGLCVAACPEGAITMVVNPAYKPPAKGFMPLLIKLLPSFALTGIQVKIQK